MTDVLQPRHASTVREFLETMDELGASKADMEKTRLELIGPEGLDGPIDPATIDAMERRTRELVRVPFTDPAPRSHRHLGGRGL